MNVAINYDKRRHMETREVSCLSSHYCADIAKRMNLAKAKVNVRFRGNLSHDAIVLKNHNLMPKVMTHFGNCPQCPANRMFLATYNYLIDLLN